MNAGPEQSQNPNQAALDRGQELARAGEAARERKMALEGDLAHSSEELSAVGRHALQAAQEQANEEFVAHSQEAASVLPPRETSESAKLAPQEDAVASRPRERTPYGMAFEQFSER